MATTNERAAVGGDPWYDPNQPGQLHDDLRRDYARTRTVALRRPSLRRHLEECGICAAIGEAFQSEPGPLAGRKRLKLVINHDQLRELLNLPASLEIVHVYADNDPNVVSVLLAGEGLPLVDPGASTPVTAPDAVTSNMITGSSYDAAGDVS